MFWAKKILDEKFLDQKLLLNLTFFWDQKFFSDNNFFWANIFLTKIFLWTKIFFWTKQSFVSPEQMSHGQMYLGKFNPELIIRHVR